MDKLTRTALYYNPDLMIARAKLAVSRAGVITARQIPNPTLNFTAVLGSAATAGAFPPGAAPVTVGPVVNFLIETFGKRAERTAQAQHLVEAARQDLATATWQVRGRVRTALLNLWAAQRRLALSRQQIVLRQQLVRLLEERFAAGYAPALDVTRERIALAQTGLGIQDLNRLEAEARVQLAAAIGVPVRALDDVRLSVAAFDYPGTPNPGLATGALRRRALSGRSDVQSSLAQYEATQSALQLQIANQYPNLLLGPGYDYDFGTNKFILNPAVDLPIFNQNQGPIAQATANRREAAASFTALQARIIGAIDAAVAAYRSTARTLGTADALLADEQVRQRQAKASFAAGEIDRPTLVTAELEAAVIRSSRFDALVLQRQALGALEDALQQPLFGAFMALSVPNADPRPATEPVP
ncbi:MAG: TolC family protein [Alphaproteobacteria bacterium]|nr:TolC family protein [Alphaproteobacteria bacterium]